MSGCACKENGERGRDDVGMSGTKDLPLTFPFGSLSMFFLFLFTAVLAQEFQTLNDTKTYVYNLIILDQSGSMRFMSDAAVSGFNEILTTAQNAQKKFADSQEHYISLVVFSGCQTSTIFDMMPVLKVEQFSKDQYHPQCSTPLYDTIGTTLPHLEANLPKNKDVSVVVTIITDGRENASCNYTSADIRKLIDRLKEDGWMISYLGTNQDAEAEGEKISISNSFSYDASARGLKDSLSMSASTLGGYYGDLYSARKLDISSTAQEKKQRRIRSFDKNFRRNLGAGNAYSANFLK